MQPDVQEPLNVLTPEANKNEFKDRVCNKDNALHLVITKKDIEVPHVSELVLEGYWNVTREINDLEVMH